jgi:DNA processing protein
LTTKKASQNSVITEMTPPAADADERLAYLALAITPGIGARKMAELLASSPTIHAAVPAGGASLAAAARVLQQCDRAGATVLVPPDAAFPARLRSIPGAPLCLFVRGDLSLVTRPCVAIVGSRDHTTYGRDAARMMAAAAASAGVVVVSGMARGLDAVAHHAVLDAGGTTIGVLGNGLGVIYPAQNRVLYERVERDGLLLTEHVPGERPHAGAFQRRNRLISGLADVLVVIEAAKGSGTMGTVAAALEQGRDVMAVPGPITSPTSAGTNQLLRDGAEPLLHPDDLVAKFTKLPARAVAEAGPVDPPPCTLSAEEAQVFSALTAAPRHVDELALATGLPVGTLLGVLCGLELGGLAEQQSGSLFRRLPRAW